MMLSLRYKFHSDQIVCCFCLLIISLAAYKASAIRLPDRLSDVPKDSSNQPLKTAVFALGSFWRSESVFGCLDGVSRTTVGYAGGSKINPEYRSLGDHAESVQASHEKEESVKLAKLLAWSPNICLCIFGAGKSSLATKQTLTLHIEYDPTLINFRQLLEVFWSSHDSRQVFGQGPDVGNQYRSMIFTNGTEESKLALFSKEREQTRSKSSIVTTQVQQLSTFYPAEPEHQKFELKRNPFLLQLIGNLPEEELEKSSLASRLNSYAAELCPSRIQRRIDGKISDIISKGWPILRDI